MSTTSVPVAGAPLPGENMAPASHAARTQAVSAAQSIVSSLQQAPVGLAAFTLPYVTLALLAVLIGIFALENVFAIAPTKGLSPGVTTLFAMGGLNRTAVFANGEWYRLFTAPLLHANLAHIVGNGVALLWGGWILERFVGRLWFFAFFVVGALGGSILSLLLMPAQWTSVGASGALMGLFAAMFVGSFRAEPGASARRRLQFHSLRILVPSLLPLSSAASIVQIDYGAHFGGVMAGAMLAVMLLRFWPKTERIPQLRTVAAVIALVGAFLFAGSVGLAVANFPKYNVMLIPSAELPKTQAERRARGAALAQRYPDDPRAHFFYGEALATAKDNAGAERELRLALKQARLHARLFGPRLEFIARAGIAMLLAEKGRRQDAEDMARESCTALIGDPTGEKLVKALRDHHLCD